MMATAESLLDIMAIPDRYPVPLFACNCRYMFSSMSACVIGPVVPEETAPSGAYLLPLVLVNELFLALLMMKAPHDDGPPPLPSVRKDFMASEYSHRFRTSFSELEYFRVLCAVKVLTIDALVGTANFCMFFCFNWSGRRESVKIIGAADPNLSFVVVCGGWFQ